jgi:hypothetical protein
MGRTGKCVLAIYKEQLFFGNLKTVLIRKRKEISRN